MAAEKDGWRPLGAVLVGAGLLTEHDLTETLAEQRRSGELLGSILVARGLVSAAAVANALAEQYGGFLKSEYGFGTGLRESLAVGSAGDALPAEAEAPPVSPAEGVGVTHLLFVPTNQGYRLLERDGPVPATGERLELPEFPGAELVVTKVTSSPLPGDPRSCAYLLEV